MLSLLLVTLFGISQVPGPTGSNLRSKSLLVQADSMLLDTSSIIPQTFTIDGIPGSDYRLDFINAILYWNNKPDRDSIRV